MVTPVRRRLIVGIYIKVMVAIVGLLSTYVALADFLV